MVSMATIILLCCLAFACCSAYRLNPQSRQIRSGPPRYVNRLPPPPPKGNGRFKRSVMNEAEETDEEVFSALEHGERFKRSADETEEEKDVVPRDVFVEEEIRKSGDKVVTSDAENEESNPSAGSQGGRSKRATQIIRICNRRTKRCVYIVRRIG